VLVLQLGIVHRVTENGDVAVYPRDILHSLED
jgi:hypothetical protein